MIKFLFLNSVFLLIPFFVFAQIPKEAFKLNTSNDSFEFIPAAEHHFNDKAPNKVELNLDGQTKKAEGFSFDKYKVKVSKPKYKKSCQVTAQLYVCDEKESYCVPRKHTYKCSGEKLEQGSSLKEKKSKLRPIKKGLFYFNSPETALTEAKAKNKLLLIDFFGIWCPPCNMLDEVVFKNAEFKRFKNDYVFLKMDADLDLSWELKSKYKVTGYPTVILAKPSGDEILRIIGSRKPKAFFKEMKNALVWKSLNTDEIKKLNSAKEVPEVKALEKALEENKHDETIRLSEIILSNEKLLEEVEWTKADLYSVMANAYEELKNEELKQKFYKKAFDEYTKMISESGLNEKTERGYNLERIYCLWKSGDYKSAQKYYQNLESIYPGEFTFYYQHAHMLKEQKKLKASLDKANKAFRFSYGDNKLRVTNLIAEIYLELDQKEKAHTILDEVMKDFKLPEDKSIRTHRYFDKLLKLRAKI